MTTVSPASLPALPCACASFRRAARALTQLYDEAVRPSGLRITQFTILQALALSGQISQGELGALLVLDSTTLTRTLRLMQRKAWIAVRQGKDRRERVVQLAPSGSRQLARATPSWEKTQARLRARLGGRSWEGLMNISNQVTNLAAGMQQN